MHLILHVSLFAMVGNVHCARHCAPSSKSLQLFYFEITKIFMTRTNEINYMKLLNIDLFFNFIFR